MLRIISRQGRNTYRLELRGTVADEWIAAAVGVLVGTMKMFGFL